MQPLNVVIAHGDCLVAESLASYMHGYFRCIAVAPTSEDVRNVIVRTKADAVVIDLDMMDLREVRQLCLEFSELSVVTTHRVPDEKMWSSSLDAGAVDCCDHRDLKNIIGTITRHGHNRHFRTARAA